MNRNQIIVVSVIAVMGIGVYLFADTKKPKDAKTADSGHTTMPAKPQQESLDIEKYIAELNSKVTDKAQRESMEKSLAAGSYKELIAQYQKLDKPLAVAYYSVKEAEKENTPKAFASAGDYNMMLIQTAPDEKAKNFLTANALAAYQKAVDLDSSDVNNRIRLAGAYMEGGSAPMQGVSILLDVVRKDSTNVDALLMLGRFGIISGQYDKAISRLERILYLHPQNSEALLLLADAYKNQGNTAKAIEMLERCKKTVTNPDAKREIDNYIQNIKKPNS
jgi:tetratricopeptide (TPR) repeat protein